MNNLNKKINIVPFALNNVENHFLNFNENEFIEGGALNAFGEKKIMMVKILNHLIFIKLLEQQLIK